MARPRKPIELWAKSTLRHKKRIAARFESLRKIQAESKTPSQVSGREKESAR
jgi:predicted transglutaminase-like protease